MKTVRALAWWRGLLAASGWVVIAAAGACQEPATSPARTSEQPSPAAQSFEEAPDLPPSAKTRYAAARILAAKGLDAQYEQALAAIIKQDPGCLPAYCDLASLRLRRGKIDGAITVLESGLKISPDDPVLLNGLGMCRLSEGSYEEALGLFTDAASLMPDNHRFRANMAVALGMLGRYEEALALYEQLVPRETAAHNLAVLRDARSRDGVPLLSHE